MVGQEGLEPPTLGLEIRCSIQLSYCPIRQTRRTPVCKAVFKSAVEQLVKTETQLDADNRLQLTIS